MKKKTLFLVVLLVGGLILILLRIYSIESANSIPDTSDAKKIISTIERAYSIEAEAAYTFDLKKFPTVFINDLRFPVDPSTLQVVREMTDSPSLESAGYLDYKLAYYTGTAAAILHSEEVTRKAKAENRALTKEETDSLVDHYGRNAPARADRPTRKFSVIIISVEIKDDIAHAIIDDGPRTVELSLVLIDGQWYIAGIKGISIHP